MADGRLAIEEGWPHHGLARRRNLPVSRAQWSAGFSPLHLILQCGQLVHVFGFEGGSGVNASRPQVAGGRQGILQ